MPLLAQRRAPAKSPQQTAKTQAKKTIPLVFDELNDFAAKGLPDSGDLPKEGNLDQAAIIMARRISKLDKDSLPMLLTALQTAGFAIVDENHKVLRRPLGDGKGQGLVFFDWETVGMLKLARPGVGTTLDKLTTAITKDTPQFPASQLSTLMLEDLRSQADNTDNLFVRFWARLIIELGKYASQPIDLMTAPPGNINLSMLQATLWTRRLTAEIYLLQNRSKTVGQTHQPFAARSSFAYADLQKDHASPFRLASFSATEDLPCQMTEAESLILDADAFVLSAAHDRVVEALIEHEIEHGGGKAASQFLGKLSAGLFGANLALAWLKLVAAVTMIRGELTVEGSLPLIRTPNSTPGERRLMKARFWSEVGHKQMLNCVRLKLIVYAGLDFALPTDGPLSEKAVEWHFAGDNETRVNDPGTRNLDKFVTFESPGTDRDPEDQVTNEEGISEMYLVGASKIPSVALSRAMLVEKQANVLVGIRLKSSKNVKQNLIDIGGTALNLAASGPLALLIAVPELGFRLPYAAAHATIPVTDHEPCNGQWQGTITYTVVNNQVSNRTIPASTDGYTRTEGGHENSDETKTNSGTVLVDGHSGLADESYDYIYTLDKVSNGTTPCCTGTAPCGRSQMGRIAWFSQSTLTRYASGNGQGKLSVSVVLEKDSYEVEIQPFAVNATSQETTQMSGKACIGNHPGSFPSKSYSQSHTGTDGGLPLLVGKAKYGADPNKLSGSYTVTLNYGAVITLTWNLRRCN